MKQPVQRRLAEILAADVAGYSRLMGADEEGTLDRLKAHRRQLVDPKIAEHRGRIVKTTGDGVLAEFASVVDAVRCALEIQRAMADRNADVPEDKRVIFRIGVNLGDVIIDGDDIYGDGVNIAARLEALAELGGVCISRTVRDHVGDRLPYAFEDIGEQSVKNIVQPVHAWAMSAAAVASLPEVALPAQPGAASTPPPRPLGYRCRSESCDGDRHRGRSLVGLAATKRASGRPAGSEPAKPTFRREHPSTTPVLRRAAVREPVAGLGPGIFC